MSQAFAQMLFEQLAKSEGWAVLSACKQDELSHDYDDKKHGVFTYYLLEGLNGPADADGDGLVTVYEASRYATLHTKRWAFKNGVQQNPELKWNVSGDIGLIKSGSGKKPPSGHEDNGGRDWQGRPSLRSITLRRHGDCAIDDAMVAYPGDAYDANYRKTCRLVDYLLGKVGVHLLSHFDIRQIRSYGHKSQSYPEYGPEGIEFPAGRISSHVQADGSSGLEYELIFTLDCSGGTADVDGILATLSLAADAGFAGSHLGWSEIEFVLDAHFDSRKLVDACKAAHLRIDSFLPDRADGAGMKISASGVGWGRDGQPASVIFENTPTDATKRVRQSFKSGLNTMLELGFYDKLNPNTVIPLFLSALIQSEKQRGHGPDPKVRESA